MEKNWIEEIREFVRKAMNEGLGIYTYNYGSIRQIMVKRRSNNSLESIDIFISENEIIINTPKSGLKKIKYNLSKRDALELDAIMLSIDEYKEDVAMSEFENFFKEGEKTPDINDLNDDD